MILGTAVLLPLLKQTLPQSVQPSPSPGAILAVWAVVTRGTSSKDDPAGTLHKQHEHAIEHGTLLCR